MDNLLLFILLSIILTWAIGLTPALLIRFVFVKRPIGRGAAIGISIALWFIFTVLTTIAAGGGRHGVFFFVALASYGIMRKKIKKQVQPDCSHL